MSLHFAGNDEARRINDVTLDPYYREFLQRQLTSGRYESEKDVIEAGLKLLEESERAHDHWIDVELPERYAEYLADPTQAVSIDQARSRFEARRAKRSSGSHPHTTKRHAAL